MIDEPKEIEYQVLTEKLDNKTVKTGPRLHHHLLLVVCLFVFPPVSLYLMWKYKEYHVWFATLSWVSGALLFVYTLILNFGILPQIQKALNSNSGGSGVVLGGSVILILITFALIQTGLGFYLKRQYKVRGDLTKGEMGLAIGLYGLGYLLPGLIYGDIVGPIYSSLNLGI